MYDLLSTKFALSNFFFARILTILKNIFLLINSIPSSTFIYIDNMSINPSHDQCLLTISGYNGAGSYWK